MRWVRSGDSPNSRRSAGSAAGDASAASASVVSIGHRPAPARAASRTSEAAARGLGPPIRSLSPEPDPQPEYLTRVTRPDCISESLRSQPSRLRHHQQPQTDLRVLARLQPARAWSRGSSDSSTAT